MQQPAIIAVIGLQRVPERVAQIQQSPPVVGFFLALVIADDPRLEGAGALDRLGLSLSVAADHRRAVLLAPFEQAGVADHAGLDDLGISRPQFPQRQRRQHTGIGQHDPRLVKCPHQILPEPGVYPSFPADRRIDLRKQRGGYLHERQPSQNRRRRESGEVPHHPAAQGDHGGPALDARGQ